MAKGKGLPKLSSLGGINGKVPGSRSTAAKMNGGKSGQKNMSQAPPSQGPKVNKVK